MPEPKKGVAQPPTHQPAGPEAEKNPQKPKPQLIDLTPEEPVNIGYMGGVRVRKTNA